MALNLLDLKAFGKHIAARHPDSQTAEIRIRVALMNRRSALGTAEIARVAGCRRGRGQSCLRRGSRNNAERNDRCGSFAAAGRGILGLKQAFETAASEGGLHSLRTCWHG